MIAFALEFQASESEKALLERIKTEIRSKLIRAGLFDIGISFRKADDRLFYVLSGRSADVEQAKRILRSHQAAFSQK